MWINNEDEEQKNQNGLNTSVGAGGGTPVAGGGTALPSGANPSTFNPVQPNQPQQKFATVQDYLGANKTQGEALGADLSGKLATSATNEKGVIDTAATQAQNDIAAGSTTFNSDLVNKAQANPTAVANSPDQLKAFLGQWNAAYTGPQSFETSSAYTPAVSATNEATQKGAELESAGGREQLLGDIYGVYGQGNKGLDQAIVQHSTAFPALQQTSSQFKSLNDYLGSTAAAINTQVQKATADTAAAKTQTQGAFTGKLSGFQNDLNTRVAAAQKSAGDVGTKWKTDLASGDPATIAADLKVAGVADADIKNLTSYLTSYNSEYGNNATGNYGKSLDLSQAYQFNPNTAITPENVATPEDYAKAQALQKLTGVDYGGVLNPANSANAGTVGSPNQLDISKLNPQVKAQLDQKDKEFLANPVNIGNDLRDMTNPDLASQYAQKYVDAITRQGQATKDNPILKNLWIQANNTLLQYSNRPDVQAGMAAIMKVVNPIMLGK